ncbi:sulfatase [Pontiella desulfatans]|nr:sulfatase [Pontiella desulfatans]
MSVKNMKEIMVRNVLLVLFSGLSLHIHAQRHNVLFIAVDDLKPWLGCYDHPVVKTPNIDRLAEMGTVFRRNYCQVALCGPTRMSIMTGLRPDTTQVYNMGGELWHIDTARKRAPQLWTIPEYFKANGYITMGFGKVMDSRNTDKGQDSRSWSGPKGVRWEWDTSLYPVKPAGGGYQDPATRRILGKAMADMKRLGIDTKPDRTAFLSTVEGARPVCEAMDLPDEAYAEGNVMAAPAIEAIKQFGENRKPFFLAVGFYKPHLPFVAPKKYWDLYSPEDFRLAFPDYPEGGSKYAETPYNEGRGFHPVPGKGPIPEELQRHMMHGYAACVSYVDAQVGKLLQALEESRLIDDTVICLWGDHGFHLGDKQVWGKHTNFEEATRAPLIIASPSIRGNRVEDEALTELVDVFPTLCELVGLEPPAGLDGESLVDLMQGRRPEENNAAVSQYLRKIDDEGLVMGWSVRTRRFRYVEWRRTTVENLHYTHSGEVIGRELYDYQSDPQETRNLATSLKHVDMCADMIREFDQVLPNLPDRKSCVIR